RAALRPADGPAGDRADAPAARRAGRLRAADDRARLRPLRAGALRMAPAARGRALRARGGAGQGHGPPGALGPRDGGRRRVSERGRDRDAAGRPRSARPRDVTGRPLPRGAAGVPPVPEPAPGPPAELLDAAQRLLDDGRPFAAHETLEAAWKA